MVIAFPTDVALPPVTFVAPVLFTIMDVVLCDMSVAASITNDNSASSAMVLAKFPRICVSHRSQVSRAQNAIVRHKPSGAIDQHQAKPVRHGLPAVTYLRHYIGSHI